MYKSWQTCIPKKCMYHQKAKYYQDSVEELMAFFKRLTIIADGIPCVRIKDPVAKAYVLQYWDTDKDGYVSEDEAAQVKFLNAFTNNPEIVSFDEFYKFRYTNVGEPLWFENCTALKSASLPSFNNEPRTAIPYRCFYQCTSLENVILQHTITIISSDAFKECSSLKEFDFSNLTSIGNGAFIRSGFERVELPKGLTTLGANVFESCPNLKIVIARCENLPAYGGNMTFSDCSKLESFVIYQQTPPTLGWRCFQNTNCMFYVPDEAVNAYKSASGWSDMQSRIKPMSEYKGEL